MLNSSFSQEEAEPVYNSRLIVGYSIGFFYPKAVNQYLEDLYSMYTFESGFPEIIINYYLNLGYSHTIQKNFDIEFLGDIAWAPKFIVITNGPSDFHSYWKFSGGILPQIKIPMKEDFLFISAGPSYNFLKFHSNEGSALGFKTKLGYIYNKRQGFQVFGMFDYAKTDIDRPSIFSGPSGYVPELSYVNFSIGANFYFGL